MAISDAGTQIINISFSSIPFPPSKSAEIMAAVAAETGLPVMPNEAAIAATLNGRSGRIFELVAISEIIGSSEYEVWAVPATRQKSHVTSGP